MDNGTARTRLRRLLAGPGRDARAAAIGAVITALAAVALSQLHHEPPSIPEQLDKLRRTAAAERMVPIVIRRVDLHGTGRETYFVVSRHQSIGLTYARAAPARVSDRIQVFDRVGDRLVERFRFQPRPRGVGRDSSPFVFRVQSSADLDSDGKPEIIGAFAEFGMEAVLFRPVLLTWDARTDRYKLASLLTHRPRLARVPHPGRFERGWRDNYLFPHSIVDPEGSLRLRAYPVEDFAIDRTKNGLVLVAGFLLRSPTHADPLLYEIKSFSLDVGLSQPITFECYPLRGNGPLLVAAKRLHPPLGQAFLRAWRAARGEC